MISSIKDLYDLENNPKINDLSLILLAEFYKEYLNRYCFQYRITDQTGEDKKEYTIDLRFDLENFCHLLGVEKTVKHVKNDVEILQYKGKMGWDNIENSKITLASLRKSTTKGNFNKNKDKYVFFYKLPKLAEAPKAVLFNKEKVLGNPTNIDCEFLFYDQYHNATIHLGIVYDEELSYYVPKTFFVERITASKDGLRFVGNQQVITVRKIDKTAL